VIALGQLKRGTNMGASEMYTLQLLGSVVLTAPSGADVTPRLLKTQGLLAFMALSDGRPVNRATLQALLWSDRMPKQGRDSLKKALSELRNCFSEGDVSPLETKGGPVTLDLSRLDIDLLNGTPVSKNALYVPQFLEGIHIKDEAFNSWLRDIRQKLDGPIPADDPPAQTPRVIPGPVSSRAHSAPLSIGVLHAGGSEHNAQSGHIANAVLNSLKQVMSQSGTFRVHDFRGSTTDEITGPRDVDMLLHLDVTRLQNDMIMSLRVTDVAQSQIIWNYEDIVHLPDFNAQLLYSKISQYFDQLCDRVMRFEGLSSDTHIAARNALGAIDHIFRLSNSDLEAADDALSTAVSMFESPAYYAWYAYLSAFQVEKQGRSDACDVVERAKYLSRRAVEMDRNNPLSLALVAHVYSFVLRDAETARELVAPVMHLSRQNVMLADTLAMMNFYDGNYSAARKYAETACSLGMSNPYRYSFTTSLAMSRMMLGDFSGAARSAKSALAQHPLRNGYRFEPTLRTLATAYSRTGQMDEGRKALAELDAQTGVSTLDRLRNADDAPFPNKDVLTMVQESLEGLYA
jgi:tetratricopeptide (TPR) repeat protein